MSSELNETRFHEMLELMREDGRQAVEAFLTAFRAGVGGQLIILAPSKHAKRPIPEAGYRSEQFAALATD